MTSPKRSAPGARTAGAPKLRVTRSYQYCPHAATLIQRLPEGGFHYAVERCCSCGAFLGWKAKPQNVERRKLNAFRLARLSMLDCLAEWERNFVRDVSKRRKLSPKQEAIMERLASQYLEGAS